MKRLRNRDGSESSVWEKWLADLRSHWVGAEREDPDPG